MLIAYRWRAAALIAALPIASAMAQTPGEWRYSIVTDTANIPADMRVNFPAITFSACRSAADFTSGRAFALQTLAASEARCPSAGFVRQPADGGGETVRFVYACDQGKTLSGMADGRVGSTRFAINLESRYVPPVNGVFMVKQTMTAHRIGPCRQKPDADEIRVE